MINQFTLELIENGLEVAAQEMFYAFGRTAKSPVIYEVLDYAVGITDYKGRGLVAQAPGVPGFSGVLDFTIREVLDKWNNNIKEGDIIATNIPYSGGTHLNDVALIMPIFSRDKLLGFIVNKGHWSEIGGMHFGSWTSDATEVFQEGLQLPNIKLFVEGKPNKDVIDIISANSRMPSATLGDMEAQIASMKVALRRVNTLIDKYGLENVIEAMDKLIEDGAKLSKLRLSKLPKGVFEAEDYIDDDGISDNPVYVKAKVTITDDNFIVDFTGSSDQVKGPINSPLPATVSAVREIFMAITDPHASPNAGYFSTLKVIAPEGSIFNPKKPAPTSTYWESMSYATDLVWKALAPHIPDKLSAGHFLSILATILGGYNENTNEPFAIVEPQPGGWGACNEKDGESALVASGDGETYIASAEVYENRMPILVERISLNTEDGSGHGKYRGGFGIIKNYIIRSKEAYFTVSIGRSKFPPWGVNGGYNGPSNYAIIYEKGEEPKIIRKAASIKLKAGDKVSLHSAGGGGWGDPLDRDPELVLNDVKNEYINYNIAQKIYGVVIENGKINYQKTLELRSKLKNSKTK
ncbi:hydantoinase B/oxoprolinase family protein [Acidianus manzaensis]|uniref:5-oxoprolinase n=1 Tax=Acidianus manzaensis TaxID=282676 RepID=A0A1W6K3D2_9CREN|nr:hydantoinase B/oxoprolinase family protein [Acidianus manzaensis]ARM76944.1 5-oxoprolinase [Acidianus manzaensis]